MQTITNINDIFVFKKGEVCDLFERLFEFIDSFDAQWKYTVKPAADALIDKLLEVSQVTKYNRNIPQSYYLFLKIMGEYDGGLLSDTLHGITDINYIIRLFENYHTYDPSFFNKGIFPFCKYDMGIELAFDLKEESQQSVWDTEGGEVFEKYAESFEKLLFQCAFRKFVTFREKLSFGSSHNLTKEAMEKNNISNLFEKIDEMANKCGISKTWFSDFRTYIGIGKGAAFYISYNSGVVGQIRGQNDKVVHDLFDGIQNFTGAKVKE